MAEAAKLLDFSQPIDVGLLDSTVNFMYGAGNDQQASKGEPRATFPLPGVGILVCHSASTLQLLYAENSSREATPAVSGAPTGVDSRGHNPGGVAEPAY